MKKVILTFSMIALGMQFSDAQIRIQAFQAVSDNSSNHSGVGINVQHSIYANQRFLPGASVGVNYEFKAIEGNDIISVPLELMVRQYLFGRHACCGGGYLEATGGAKFISFASKTRRNFDNPTSVPIASLGLGYRTGMSYDFTLFYGADFEKNNIGSVVGIKLGYNL